MFHTLVVMTNEKFRAPKGIRQKTKLKCMGCRDFTMLIIG